MDGENKCKHSLTQADHCMNCGIKVMERDERVCGTCKYYRPYSMRIGTCLKKLMGVPHNMHVTYVITEGTCWEDTEDARRAIVTISRQCGFTETMSQIYQGRLNQEIRANRKIWWPWTWWDLMISILRRFKRNGQSS